MNNVGVLVHGTITTDGEPRKTQGIAVNPTLSPTCKMILSGENSNGDSVLIQAGDSATQTTTFTKSPESILTILVHCNMTLL